MPAWAVAATAALWATRSRGLAPPQVAVLALAAFAGLASSGAALNVRIRSANELAPAIARIKDRLPEGELVSLGRVYHRFAYAYETPIRQVPWPTTLAEVPPGLSYFCFDHRPSDTPELRSSSDGRLSTSTPGTLPFAWDEIQRIDCDPAVREVHTRTVVVGRVRRPLEGMAMPGGGPANQPAPRR